MPESIRPSLLLRLCEAIGLGFLCSMRVIQCELRKKACVCRFNFHLVKMNALIDALQDTERFPSEKQANNANELAHELIALQSIYGTEEVELKSGANVDEPTLFVVRLPCEKSGDFHVKLQVRLPKGYPNCDEAPALELVNRTLGSFQIDDAIRDKLSHTFSPEGSAPWVKGEPVLFQGIDSASESLQDWWDERSKSVSHEDDEAPRDAHQKPQTASSRQADLRSLVHSDTILERKSEFLGHAARISHPDEVSERRSL